MTSSSRRAGTSSAMSVVQSIGIGLAIRIAGHIHFADSPRWDVGTACLGEFLLLQFTPKHSSHVDDTSVWSGPGSHVDYLLACALRILLFDLIVSRDFARAQLTLLGAVLGALVAYSSTPAPRKQYRPSSRLPKYSLDHTSKAKKWVSSLQPASPHRWENAGFDYQRIATSSTSSQQGTRTTTTEAEVEVTSSVGSVSELPMQMQQFPAFSLPSAAGSEPRTVSTENSLAVEGLPVKVGELPASVCPAAPSIARVNSAASFPTPPASLVLSPPPPQRAGPSSAVKSVATVPNTTPRTRSGRATLVPPIVTSFPARTPSRQRSPVVVIPSSPKPIPVLVLEHEPEPTPVPPPVSPEVRQRARAQTFRRKAFDMEKLRDDYRSQESRATQTGDGAAALVAKAGKEESDKEAHKLHTLAAAILFKLNNVNSPDGVIELVDLIGSEPYKKTEEALADIIKNKPTLRQLRVRLGQADIYTRKGNIRRALKGQGMKCRDALDDPCALLIEIPT